MEGNRIVLNAPQSIFEALELAERELPSIRLIRTALHRYVVPAWGGPGAKPGEQVSYAASEFLKTVPLEQLLNAAQVLEHYFEGIGADKSCRRRNRHYLKRFVDWVQQKRWLVVQDAQHREPQFNRFNRPKGQRRISATEVRTTGMKHPPAYSLGTQPQDWVLVDGQKVLGNLRLHQELQQLREYGNQGCKTKKVEMHIGYLKSLLGYLHRIKQVTLDALCLDLLVRFVQLRFSEADFEGNDAFAVNARGHLIKPELAEETLDRAERRAQRNAKQLADTTLKLVEAFFQWRQQELTICGKPEGLSPGSKLEVLRALIFLSKERFRDQTDTEERANFEDISVIQRLRLRMNQEQVDVQKTQKQIRKRCISWPQAMQVFEKQRLQSLEYHRANRNPQSKSGKSILPRPTSAIALDFQKTVVCGLMMLIPTDRQQTYRRLEYGKTLKNGYFADDDGEQFVTQAVPTDPNAASFWLNLEDFKTVQTYGEFWYPVPNVQFADGTTFYQYIASFLWGFWDEAGVFPTYYKGDDNQHWQGWIDAEGNRCGWRAALQPQHELMFTMPLTKTPFNENTFSHMIRNLFVRFTQEDGPPVPVTPHSLRHMLSTYLNRLGIGGEEEKSFAYVLHHSPEMNQGRYVFKNNMTRIAPAVKRMEAIIKSFL